MRTIARALAAILLGAGTWWLVMLALGLLDRAGVPVFAVAVWLSHLSPLGWLFAAALAAAWFYLLPRLIPALVEARSIAQDGGGHAT